MAERPSREDGASRLPARASLPRGSRLQGPVLGAAIGLVGVGLLAALLAPRGRAAPDGRRFEFLYSVRIGPLPAGDAPAEVFVPIASSDPQQQVERVEIQASLPGTEEREETYGNRFWHAHLAHAAGRTIDVRVRYVIVRSRFESGVIERASARLDGSERRRLARFLGPNRRVPVGAPILRPILDEIQAASRSPSAAARARAIYDWVVDHVEYKKVGTGWGNGDTYWACNERYGNCTDFHALYISLARTLGIPARFDIGFPVPEGRRSGEVSGYHCWVQLWLPGVGWMPIDASEASKHPELRESYFGAQAADRIRLTTGRDLRLGRSHRGPALNYFVYPYVEVGGRPWKGTIERRFSYRDLSSDRVAARS